MPFAARAHGVRSTTVSQARDGAIIVASCKPISDDDSDPPCIRAKREYQAIVDDAKGAFYCTGEYPKVQGRRRRADRLYSDGAGCPATVQEGSRSQGGRGGVVGAHADAAWIAMTAIDDALDQLRRHRGL